MKPRELMMLSRMEEQLGRQFPDLAAELAVADLTMARRSVGDRSTCSEPDHGSGRRRWARRLMVAVAGATAAGSLWLVLSLPHNAVAGTGADHNPSAAAPTDPARQ